MLYFKKAELAETYHVSEKTVTNWMRDAKDGKNDLELYEVNQRSWIANTTRNIVLIETLVERGRKYRNSLSYKTVTPSAEFYKLHSDEQVFDIISNMELYGEIPYQYGYFGEGAKYWDEYAVRLAAENVPNLQTATLKQVRTNLAYLDDLLEQYDKVNVIDTGVGNVQPARPILEYLVKQGKLGRYIAYDLSPEMIIVAKRNIDAWFGNKVQFESYLADMNYQRFSPVLLQDVANMESHKSVNLVLALGGTMMNLRQPADGLKTLHDSMQQDDIMVYNLKLDNVTARHYFDFVVGKLEPLHGKAKMLVDRLNIDESLYDVELGYSETDHERYIRIRFKITVNIVFTFKNGTRTVTFNKNDTLKIFRYEHQTAEEVLRQLKQVGFDVLQASLTEDKNYLLTISRIKTTR